MKRILVFIIAAAFTFAAFGDTDAECRIKYKDHDSYLGFRDDDVEVDFDDGSIIFYSDRDDDEVEITEDYELLINGKRIKLDKDQEKLVERYYDNMEDIVDFAKELGIEGAKIGASGAKLGLDALAKVFMLLDDDYDSDDLEKEMEKAADKIERRAKKLEKKAEKIEDMADDLERTHRKLRRAVPELDELGWF